MMRTAYDGPADADVPRPMLHLVADLDGKHVDGHNRLSSNGDKLEARIVALELLTTNHDEQLKNAAKRTTDIRSIRWTTGNVAAVVAVCASIIGGAYASTWGLKAEQAGIRSDVRVLSAKMEAKAELEQERNKNVMLQVVIQGGKIEAMASQVTSLEGQMRELSATMKRSK